MSELLTGEVLSLRKFSSGWGFGNLRTEEDKDVRFVGTIHKLAEGQWVSFEGEWDMHPKFGKQFKILRFVEEDPRTHAGVLLWMTTYIPLLGPVLSQRLLDTFGDELWTVIDEEPHRLREVDGIGEERESSIVHAYVQFNCEREAMSRFFAYGFTQKEAEHIIATLRRKLLGDDIILEDIIASFEKDPYALYVDHGLISFSRIDLLAQKAGIGRNDMRRTSAAVLYTLELWSFQGHTAGYFNELDEGFGRKLMLSTEAYEEACLVLIDKKALVTYDIDSETTVLMHRKHAADEASIAQGILQRVKETHD